MRSFLAVGPLQQSIQRQPSELTQQSNAGVYTNTLALKAESKGEKEQEREEITSINGYILLRTVIAPTPQRGYVPIGRVDRGIVG